MNAYLSFFKNLKIAHKMLMLSGVLLLGIMLAACIYYFNTALREESTQHQYDNDALQMALSKIHLGILYAREAQLAYAGNYHSNDLSNFYIQINDILKGINTMADLLGDQEAPAALALTNAAWTYKMSMDEYAGQIKSIGFMQEDGYWAALKASTVVVDNALNAMHQSGMMVHWFRIRQNEQHFFSAIFQMTYRTICSSKKCFLLMSWTQQNCLLQEKKS